MACTKLIVLVSILAVVLPKDTMAREYWVGGESGWTKDFDYQAWAKDKMFYVGDTLVFKYQVGNHNVFKVNGTAFKDCTIPPANGALTSGNDSICRSSPSPSWRAQLRPRPPTPTPLKECSPLVTKFFLAAAGIFVAMIVA
ncbi:hypothetical protein Acr_08g0018790 [Actinidia rufa]|uniref:Phytocyanin domain-containing protein n=1 Tax=Actinidia rufa TaxID=165716 RepID=A0A7J0F4F0_9ERIC|nr:hypothetical protein Acr_08g0018790 [Actinidia rufa]